MKKYTAQEAADLVKVTVQTVRSFARGNGVRGFNGRYEFRDYDIQRLQIWLKQRKKLNVYSTQQKPLDPRNLTSVK